MDQPLSFYQPSHPCPHVNVRLYALLDQIMGLQDQREGKATQSKYKCPHYHFFNLSELTGLDPFFNSPPQLQE